MPSEDAAHDIFVNLDAERMSHLLGNARTTESRIATLHFEDRRDEFLRGPFGTWPSPGSGCEQQSVFPLDQRPVKAQPRRGLDSNGNLCEAVASNQEGTNAEQEPIPGRESRSSVARSAEDQELMFQKE